MSEKKEIKVLVKPGCEKCKAAKELAEKLKDKYKVTILSIDTAEGLAEFTYYNLEYTPAIIFDGKVYVSIKQAEKELLGDGGEK